MVEKLNKQSCGWDTDLTEQFHQIWSLDDTRYDWWSQGSILDLMELKNDDNEKTRRKKKTSHKKMFSKVWGQIILKDTKENKENCPDNSPNLSSNQQ